MDNSLSSIALATIVLGLCVFAAIKLFADSSNPKKKKWNQTTFPFSSSSSSSNNSSSNKKNPQGNTMNVISDPSSSTKREISVCPFSSESTFIMETANHLEPSPLDIYDEDDQWQQQKQGSLPPLGLRWLAAGISGQDQPGYLRAQLQRFRHHRHFLLEDGYFEEEFKLKENGFQERYEETFVMEKDSLDAQQETLELFMAYLPQRYPEIYKYNEERDSITVIPMAKEFHLKDYRDRPLELCARIVQEDLVLMRENTATSSYNMAAAAVVFSFNELPRRLGTTTNFIHAPVPGFERHLNKVLYLSFKNLRVEKPLWRNNWSIVPSGQIDEPSDSVTHADELEALSTQDVKDRFLKVEYQTIRRLPRSNYLLFTIRTFTDPVVSLEQVPTKAAATLAASIRGMTPNMLKYRGIESEETKTAALQYLDSISTSTNKG